MNEMQCDLQWKQDSIFTVPIRPNEAAVQVTFFISQSLQNQNTLWNMSM
jgi:hypothetical protein